MTATDMGAGKASKYGLSRRTGAFWKSLLLPFMNRQRRIWRTRREMCQQKRSPGIEKAFTAHFPCLQYLVRRFGKVLVGINICMGGQGRALLEKKAVAWH